MFDDRFGSYSICVIRPGTPSLLRLKVNDAIEPLVTAAAPANRDPAVVVATGNTRLGLEQRLLRIAPTVNSSRVR
jgi:hypothetical protein